MANHVKPRSQEQTAISVSITKDLLTRINNRANELGLSRSGLYRRLQKHGMA